jgi:hypothetical protein
MRAIGVAAGSIFALLGVSVALWPPAGATSLPAAAEQAIAGEAPRDLEREVAELRRELAELRAEQRRSAVPVKHELAARPVTEVRAETPPMPELEEARERDETILAELDSRMAWETRDPAWSEGQERALLAAIGEQGTRPISIECASTLCRVEVEVVSPEAIGGLDELLDSDLAPGGGFMKPEPSESGPYRSYVYLFR